MGWTEQFASGGNTPRIQGPEIMTRGADGTGSRRKSTQIAATGDWNLQDPWQPMGKTMISSVGVRKYFCATMLLTILGVARFG